MRAASWVGYTKSKCSNLNQNPTVGSVVARKSSHRRRRARPFGEVALVTSNDILFIGPYSESMSSG